MTTAVRVYTSVSKFLEEFPEASETTSNASFFVTLDWFRILFDTAIDRSELSPRLYLLVDEANGPMVLLPMLADEKNRQLVSATTFYSILFQPIVYDSSISSNVALSQIFQFIVAERPKWRSVSLRYLDRDYIEDNKLLNVLESNGLRPFQYFQFDNWHLPVKDMDFEFYFKSLPSRVRNTIVRKEKKLRKNHEIDIHIFKSQQEIDAHIHEYEVVYNSSWKNPEPFPKFIPELLRRSATLGLLRLGILYIDAEPAAAQIWITHRGQSVIYKLAYDERYSAMSPGSVLSRELFRISLDDDKVKSIDYGVGSEAYKRDWMSANRCIDGITAYNITTVNGFLRFCYEQLKTVAKTLLRSGQGKNARVE